MASKHFDASPEDVSNARRLARMMCERFPEQVCDLQGIKRGEWGETDIPPPLRPDEGRLATDIIHVHTKGNKLKLAQMVANADTFDVVHDVMGIVQYLDRSNTDKAVFREHFEPRYTDYQARKEDANA